MIYVAAKIIAVTNRISSIKVKRIVAIDVKRIVAIDVKRIVVIDAKIIAAINAKRIVATDADSGATYAIIADHVAATQDHAAESPAG